MILILAFYLISTNTVKIFKHQFSYTGSLYTKCRCQLEHCKLAGIFLCSQWNLGDFFPILKKNPNLKKIYFFLKIEIFIQSPHTSYMVTIYYHCILFLLQFNGKVCVITNLFLLTNIT